MIKFEHYKTAYENLYKNEFPLSIDGSWLVKKRWNGDITKDAITNGMVYVNRCISSVEAYASDVVFSYITNISSLEAYLFDLNVDETFDEQLKLFQDELERVKCEMDKKRNALIS